MSYSFSQVNKWSPVSSPGVVMTVNMGNGFVEGLILVQTFPITLAVLRNLNRCHSVLISCLF